MPSWRSLDPVELCSLRDGRIRNGNYVVSRLQGERVPSEEENDTKVREIRTLPDPDPQSLIRIAGPYRMGKRLYESKHYQIMLWNAVNGIPVD